MQSLILILISVLRRKIVHNRKKSITVTHIVLHSMQSHYYCILQYLKLHNFLSSSILEENNTRASQFFNIWIDSVIILLYFYWHLLYLSLVLSSLFYTLLPLSLFAYILPFISISLFYHFSFAWVSSSYYYYNLYYLLSFPHLESYHLVSFILVFRAFWL